MTLKAYKKIPQAINSPITKNPIHSNGLSLYLAHRISPAIKNVIAIKQGTSTFTIPPPTLVNLFSVVCIVGYFPLW